MSRLILVLTFSILCACSDYSQPSTPDRPPSVPGTAVWYGGADGGDWRDCKKMGARLDCSVYSGPFVGDLVYTQSFVLCGLANPSEWMGFMGGINYDVDVRSGGLYWSPVSPAIVYRDGSIDKELTAKSERLFAEEYDGPCSKSFLSEF